jgi:hypothetical protein
MDIPKSRKVPNPKCIWSQVFQIREYLTHNRDPESFPRAMGAES